MFQLISSMVFAACLPANSLFGQAGATADASGRMEKISELARDASEKGFPSISELLRA